MSIKARKTSHKPEKYIIESIKIDKLIPGGQALGTLSNGKKIFLWNALPNETVTKARVTKEKSNYVEGIAEEFSQISEFRTKPKDQCYLSTSPWQILTENYEKEQKDILVKEILRQHNINIPESFYDFHIEVDEQCYYYRNKMEYSLYYSHDDQKIHLAFHERGSHRKIPIDQSSIERPEIWQHAQKIIKKLNCSGEDARKYQSLLLRCDQSGNVSGGLFENGKPHPVFPTLQDELFGVKYSYSPNGFFQINLPVYKSTLRTMAKFVRGHSILDLYAGVGTIGYSLATLLPAIDNLTLVECNPSACEELFINNNSFSGRLSSLASRGYDENVSSNLQKISYPIQAKAEDTLDYVAPDQTVIVDPPRAGCVPEVIERFLEVEPAQIMYLSCNPATQARDVQKLLEKYEISLLQPYNFFPRTPHIENLIILNHK